MKKAGVGSAGQKGTIMQLVDTAVACARQPLIKPARNSSKQQLADLAKQICAEHHAATAALTACAEHAMVAGDLLIEAKSHVAHGQWEFWIESNCKISVRTARVYMQLAENRTEIESKRQSSADLSIAGALKLISAPPKNGAPARTTSSPIVDKPKSEKRSTCHDIMAVWINAPDEEKRRFVVSAGRDLLRYIPEAWIDNIRQPDRPQPAPASNNLLLQIPDDLSVPAFLKRKESNDEANERPPTNGATATKPTRKPRSTSCAKPKPTQANTSKPKTTTTAGH